MLVYESQGLYELASGYACCMQVMALHWEVYPVQTMDCSYVSNYDYKHMHIEN